jgi:hypothetical protein
MCFRTATRTIVKVSIPVEEIRREPQRRVYPLGTPRSLVYIKVPLYSRTAPSHLEANSDS